MNCEDVKPQLTSYLDGELEDDRGSAVRGHLRGCDACRTAANDEAALRDGLRALPALDVPSSMWAGVQAKLAAAEVADAEQPHWRRVMHRWSERWKSILRPAAWMTPRFALASSAVAVIVCVWAWRYTHRATDMQTVDLVAMMPKLPAPPLVAPAPVGNAGDVATEIAALPKKTTDSYAEAAQELVAMTAEARKSWPDDQKKIFDTKFADLQRAVDGAAEGRPRQKAYRELIRYLRRVATRDEVAFAEVTP